MPPSRLQKRWAVGVMGMLLLVFAAIVPVASIQLVQENGFIPTVQAIIFVTDLATAVLLFNQFAILRARELLILADGYLFSALMVIPHGLSFPGAFTATGIFGPSLETTPWLFTFWHFGFSSAALFYACVKDGKKPSRADRPSARAAIYLHVFVVTGLVCLLTFIATRAEVLLPNLMRNAVQFAPMANYVTVATFLVTLAALIVLLIRGRSLLDLWLAVVLVALVLRMAITSFLITSRFSFGFYVSRLFSIVIATVVLLVLLSEMIHLYGRLSNSNMRLRRERESKLRNLEAAIAAVSHEMKQPLTGIALKGTAALRLLAAPTDNGCVRKVIEDMVESSHRAGAVLDNIRALFKPGDPSGKPIEINELIREGLQILRDDVESHGISVRTHFDPGLPSIIGHKGQLQEVILNVIQNSIDAMKITESRKRLLQVKTENLDQKTIAISVSDSGPGIAADKISNVFEAFATTKADGMGLGLAISQMIIERHGGKISASTSPNGGARVEIKLPIVPVTISQEAHVG
jgi:signal transduction histidine kinase